MDGKKDARNAKDTKHAGYAENTTAWKDAYTEYTTNAHFAKEKKYPRTKKKPYEWEYDSKKPSNYQKKTGKKQQTNIPIS